jgi:pSer/pThr/pTyr-binding forkhead associated (FHA) protein
MATQTPLRTPDQPLDRAPRPEPASTEPLEIAGEPTLDSLRLLDHRARSRALVPRLAPPGHYLSMQDGEEERLIPINDHIIHVGRGAAADLRFEEARVSRSHAIIVRYGHHVRVLDDRSANGTFVNDCRIVATDVADGDVIRLGRVAFRYRRLR